MPTQQTWRWEVVGFGRSGAQPSLGEERGHKEGDMMGGALWRLERS